MATANDGASRALRCIDGCALEQSTPNALRKQARWLSPGVWGATQRNWCLLKRVPVTRRRPLTDSQEREGAESSSDKRILRINLEKLQYSLD